MKALALLRHELASYFRSFLGYGIAAVFLGLSGYFFVTNLSFFVLMGGFDLNRGLWQHQFHDMRLLLLVFAPLLTMRSFAEERRQGTLELLWTYPVRDGSIVVGKYLASFGVLLFLLVLSGVYPFVLLPFYPVDPGPVLAGYLGLALLGAAFLAFGIFVSSLTGSQLLAGAVTFGVLFLFWILAWNEPALAELGLSFVLPLSLFDRFAPFARGVVDGADVTFFAAFVTVFLFATNVVLESRRWRRLP